MRKLTVQEKNGKDNSEKFVRKNSNNDGEVNSDSENDSGHGREN